MRTRPLLVLLLALVALSAACTSDDAAPDAGGAAAPAAGDATDAASELETIPLPGATETPDVDPPAAAAATTPPPQRSVEITSPADGATVTAPVTIEVAVEGFTLKPIDGSFEEDSGHLYAYIDREPPTEQERIPESPDIVRFAEPQVQLADLAPGQHTVTVIASHGYPVPMMPIVSDEVTFTVE